MPAHRLPAALTTAPLTTAPFTTTVTATAEHPFLTGIAPTEWTPAHELEVRQHVFSASSGWLRVGSATLRQASAPTYNLEVEGDHTYFVSELGAAVHNGSATTKARHSVLSRHFGQVLNDPSNVVEVLESGVTVRQSLLMGPRGAVRITSRWDGDRLLSAITEAGPRR